MVGLGMIGLEGVGLEVVDLEMVDYKRRGPFRRRNNLDPCSLKRCLYGHFSPFQCSTMVSRAFKDLLPQRVLKIYSFINLISLYIHLLLPPQDAT